MQAFPIWEIQGRGNQPRVWAAHCVVNAPTFWALSGGFGVWVMRRGRDDGDEGGYGGRVRDKLGLVCLHGSVDAADVVKGTTLFGPVCFRVCLVGSIRWSRLCRYLEISSDSL
jgi:hypothetical protein